MKKKIGIIVCCYYFTLVLAGLSSCNPCGNVRDKFRVTSLDWKNYKVTATGELEEIENNTVAYNEYAIKLVADVETYYSYKTPALSAPLFACSPADPTTDDTITDIQIVANKDFDDDYLAGENLAELFDVIVYDYNIINERFDLIDFLNTNPFAPRQITLVLKQQPETDSEFQFTVKYYQDGEVLDYAEFTTNSIMITN